MLVGVKYMVVVSQGLDYKITYFGNAGYLGKPKQWPIMHTKNLRVWVGLCIKIKLLISAGVMATP